MILQTGQSESRNSTPQTSRSSQSLYVGSVCFCRIRIPKVSQTTFFFSKGEESQLFTKVTTISGSFRFRFCKCSSNMKNCKHSGLSLLHHCLLTGKVHELSKTISWISIHPGKNISETFQWARCQKVTGSWLADLSSFTFQYLMADQVLNNVLVLSPADTQSVSQCNDNSAKQELPASYSSTLRKICYQQKVHPSLQTSIASS